MVQYVLGRFFRCLCSAVLDGDLERQEIFLMAEYQKFEHDVLVIGAGGAGLRAAIEASASAARVGLVCKSLLGNAHTVMAEGGIGARLGTVNQAGKWEAAFADTMLGGQRAD